MAVSVKVLTKVKLDGADASFPVPVVLFSNTTPVGNVGTGQDDLMTYSIPAGTLANNGDSIEFRGAWKWGGNDAAIGKVVFNGTPSVDVNIGDSDFTSFTARIVRISSTVAIFWMEAVEAASAAVKIHVDEVTGLNFAGALVMKTTGEATVTDDIIQSWFYGVYFPAP